MERQLENNFKENQAAFLDLIPLVDNTSSIRFEIVPDDTIIMTFRDSQLNSDEIHFAESYILLTETKSEFRINESGCLQVINMDTTVVRDNNWHVQFVGHYKDDRIDQFLEHMDWDRRNFETLVESVQELNCIGFWKEKNKLCLNYGGVSYYNDGIIHCFGHSDGYFDYLYTSIPDSFYWQNSYKQLDGDYYAIEQWNF